MMLLHVVAFVLICGWGPLWPDSETEIPEPLGAAIVDVAKAMTCRYHVAVYPNEDYDLTPFGRLGCLTIFRLRVRGLIRLLPDMEK